MAINVQIPAELGIELDSLWSEAETLPTAATMPAYSLAKLRLKDSVLACHLLISAFLAWALD